MNKQPVISGSTTAYIALGSNLNDPEQQLNTAIKALEQFPQSRVVAVSSFYQTVPVGLTAQPDYINAVLCLETMFSAMDLLYKLQEVEQNQGRIRGAEKNGPRTLDLDLLLYGQHVINTLELVVPHPRMHERTFVLIPLLEIAPELALPPDGQKLKKHLLLTSAY